MADNAENGSPGGNTTEPPATEHLNIKAGILQVPKKRMR